ncbi:DMT family transporter, partial [Leuconostoc falkenbergense]|uniref:DMT family transporter n=1 Tax=Leuconostoc falkenbergense TaxID=2766470 RepID=UPI0028A5A7B5
MSTKLCHLRDKFCPVRCYNFFIWRSDMSWIFLLMAGLSEILWSTAMKLSDGFSKNSWAIVTVVGLIASMLFLLQAVKH